MAKSRGNAASALRASAPKAGAFSPRAGLGKPQVQGALGDS